MIFVYLAVNAAAEWHFLRTVIYVPGESSKQKSQHWYLKNAILVIGCGVAYRYYSLLKIVAIKRSTSCFESSLVFYLLLFLNVCLFGLSCLALCWEKSKDIPLNDQRTPSGTSSDASPVKDNGEHEEP